MKKIENELKEIINTINGRLLLIGSYSYKLQKNISDNTKITFCDQLVNSDNYTGSSKGKSKKINIKNIKKYYKKNKINNMIVNFFDIKEYKNNFIKDSNYITKDMIIIIDKENNDTIYKMYKRYSNDIEIINCLDGRIFKIKSTNSNNIFKNMFYLIKDFLTDILDVISNLL